MPFFRLRTLPFVCLALLPRAAFGQAASETTGITQPEPAPPPEPSALEEVVVVGVTPLLGTTVPLD